MDLFTRMTAQPDLSGLDEPIYANVAHVSSTPYDFRLTFSLFQTPHDRPVDDAQVPPSPPRAVVEVVLPAGSVHSMLDAVRAELDRYTARYGAPHPSVPQGAPR
ncbi:MAG TPA: hypothetical protein VHT75_18560 [Acidimicrobiales bacterium]|nr:hypothetical protein [Acidimicrobiales bacterium]